MSQTTKKLEEYLSRRLEEFELAALMLDGLEVAGQTVVVTLGITIDGTKVPLGIWLGSTENSRVCTAMLQDLLERGLRVDASILCVVDGGKGIRKALVDVLGDLAVIQRCQIHKLRNLRSYLPKSRHAYVLQTMKEAYKCLGAQLAISVHNCPVLTDSRFPMSIFKRTQRKYVKKAYRVRNWREYEAGLRNRGSLTVWVSLTAGKLVNWDAPRPRRRKPGRQRKYSNHAIETAVTLGMVFHLSSRQSEGLLRSLFALMKLDNDVPDHTTISRRKAKLGKVPFYQDKQKTPLHILIDSSGLAVHAGQLRRAPKSRDYRKLHLCVDEQTGEVVAGELTSKRARDSSRVASLVGQIDSPISSARADTAYDASGVYEAIENHSAHRSPRVLIPPRKGAQLASGPASSRQRNRNIAAQARLGKRKWHTESGYSKRSKVETTFHRYKAIVGSAMRARGLAAQRVEARIGCKILNTMTALGMPDSEMIG